MCRSLKLCDCLATRKMQRYVDWLYVNGQWCSSWVRQSTEIRLESLFFRTRTRQWCSQEFVTGAHFWSLSHICNLSAAEKNVSRLLMLAVHLQAMHPLLYLWTLGTLDLNALDSKLSVVWLADNDIVLIFAFELHVNVLLTWR